MSLSGTTAASFSDTISAAVARSVADSQRPWFRQIAYNEATGYCIASVDNIGCYYVVVASGMTTQYETLGHGPVSSLHNVVNHMVAGLACDGAGVVYMADPTHNSIARFGRERLDPWRLDQYVLPPDGLAVRRTDRVLLVAIPYSFVIVALSLDTGRVCTALGSGRSGHADGFGIHVSFRLPSAICCDARGNTYVADLTAVRLISPAGAVTTIAGDNSLTSSPYVGGCGAAARFRNLVGICVDDRGSTVYVADARAVYRLLPQLLEEITSPLAAALARTPAALIDVIASYLPLYAAVSHIAHAGCDGQEFAQLTSMAFVPPDLDAASLYVCDRGVVRRIDLPERATHAAYCSSCYPGLASPRSTAK